METESVVYWKCWLTNRPQLHRFKLDRDEIGTTARQVNTNQLTESDFLIWRHTVIQDGDHDAMTSFHADDAAYAPADSVKWRCMPMTSFMFTAIDENWMSQDSQTSTCPRNYKVLSPFIKGQLTIITLCRKGLTGIMACTDSRKSHTSSLPITN